GRPRVGGGDRTAADELLTTRPPGGLEFGPGEERVEGCPEWCERRLDAGTTLILLPVNQDYRAEHAEPFLAALPDRVDEGAPARDDVLDHDHGIARDDRAFEPAPRTVRLGGLAHGEPGERSRRPGAVEADGGRHRGGAHRRSPHGDSFRGNELMDEAPDERRGRVVRRREGALDVVVGEPPRGESELLAGL